MLTDYSQVLCEDAGEYSQYVAADFACRLVGSSLRCSVWSRFIVSTCVIAWIGGSVGSNGYPPQGEKLYKYHANIYLISPHFSLDILLVLLSECVEVFGFEMDCSVVMTSRKKSFSAMIPTKQRMLHILLRLARTKYKYCVRCTEYSFIAALELKQTRHGTRRRQYTLWIHRSTVGKQHAV